MGMALLVFLPRFLGDAEFGRLHLALSLTMMFGVAVEFGLTQVVIRAVAARKALARPYLRSAVTTS
jgi:O-antigen/teichoic acid export membrane protein